MSFLQTATAWLSGNYRSQRCWGSTPAPWRRSLAAFAVECMLRVLTHSTVSLDETFFNCVVQGSTDSPVRISHSWSEISLGGSDPGLRGDSPFSAVSLAFRDAGFNSSDTRRCLYASSHSLDRYLAPGWSAEHARDARRGGRRRAGGTGLWKYFRMDLKLEAAAFGSLCAADILEREEEGTAVAG